MEGVGTSLSQSGIPWHSSVEVGTLAIHLYFLMGRLTTGAHCIRSEAFTLVWKNLQIFALLDYFAFRSDISLAICQIWHGSLEKWRRMFELIERLLPIHLCDSEIHK